MQITLDNLTFAYRRAGLQTYDPQSRATTPALQGITATIGPGLHLLLGENGAGKTTLLHLIAGLLFPSAGECKIDGCPTRFRLPSIQSHLFFTGINLKFPGRTIAEMVRMHAQFYPRFSPEMLAENLAAFGLDADTKLTSLSEGNLQKAKVAYALSLRTDILLLDEPTNGLDIESKLLLQKMIAKNISEDQTIIVSTHSVKDLQNLYDGVIDLHQGRLQYALSIDEITKKLKFVTSASPLEEALYSEMRIGQYFNILSNDDDTVTDPDFELLYMAVRHSNHEIL